METELREMLRDRADGLPPPGELPPPVLRTARRRRWATGTLATLTAVVVLAGSVVGLQAALGHRGATRQGQQPTPSEEPTTSTTAVPPVAASADVHSAIWPVTDGLTLAGLQASVTAGKDQWVTDPSTTALRFAQDVMGWDPADVGLRVSGDLLAGTAEVELWNRGMGDYSPGIAETLSLSRVGGTKIWLVMHVSTGLLDVTSPSEHQDLLPPNAAVEVAGSLGLPPLGWTLTTILEYADSLLQGSEAQTRTDLPLDGLGFDVTLEPNAAYLDGPTLSLRLVDADGNTLGLYARRFASGPAPSPSPTSSPPTTDSGVFAVMLTTIRAASPPHWTFDLTPGRLDGDWTLDGTVDDGSGPGRLMIDVTDRPGMLEAHPCSDPEFTQGAPCVEEQGVGGSLLVLRDVLDQKGNKTIEVVLVRPDRSGIGAEAGNWIISGTPGNAGGGSNEQVTRADPVFSVEQLGNLVQAVAEKVYPCIQAGC